jgi:hypothetical protein
VSEDIEGMRYELGKESAQKGETLHKGASEEFMHGYTDTKPSAWGGSSNVMPRLFGKGNDPSYKDWTCVCGSENRRFYKRCPMCNLSRQNAYLAEQNG